MRKRQTLSLLGISKIFGVYGLYDGPGPFLLGNMEVASVEANIHPKPIMYEISSIYYKMGDTGSAREWMDRYDSFPE